VAPGSGWSYVGCTLNRFKYPDDIRLHSGKDATWVRTIRGKKFIFLEDMYSGPLAIYRFNAASDGETAIPCGVIANGHLGMEHGAYPPNEPGKEEWIWRDANGNGDFDRDEYTQTTPPSTWNVNWGWWVDSKGDIWQTGNGLRHFKCQGLDAHGSPIYDFAPTHLETIAMPAPFNELRRVVYLPDTDCMYLVGYSANYPFKNYSDEWKMAGCLICCYQNWSKGNRVANWQIPLPDGNGHDKQVLSIAVEGDYLFTTLVNPANISVYKLSDGSFFDSIIPKGVYTGWADIPYALAAHRRANGEYDIYAEEDGAAKVMLYRWPAPK
jgi:hypothetical protein